ncbi:hypothetical protein M3Y96_01095000 [Aphelenchoides besseyi]|nr:hypothetical protein M3Y96_01095000 [Aphelenchoides besseyi]
MRRAEDKNGPVGLDITNSIVFVFDSILAKDSRSMSINVFSIQNSRTLRSSNPRHNVDDEMEYRRTCAHISVLEYVIYYMEQSYDLVRVWIGPFPVVVPYSADSIREVLESNIVITKGDEYNILKRWLGSGLLISSGDKWRQRRKLLTPAFHFGMLNKFQAVHNQEAKILTEQLEQFAESGERFDIYPFLKRCALDIICETSMGVKVNAQSNHDHPYVNSVKKLNKLSFAYGRMPWLWIRPIWVIFGYEAEYVKHLKLVTDFTRKNSRKKSAFLDLLLSVQKEGQLTNEDIREEVETVMFEGHDTTSSGLAWTLWCLAHHPTFQDRVIDEVDRIFGHSDRPCTADDLKELQFLEQCIKESHRLFPPVPMLFRKVEQDFVCAKYTVPKGTTLFVCPVLVHISGKYYDKPFAYNPDHFQRDTAASRHPFAYIPFSAGPRNCIGQKFALMEEKTVLSWFFRRYRLQPHMPLFLNFPLPEIILKPSRGIRVTIEKRHH